MSEEDESVEFCSPEDALRFLQRKIETAFRARLVEALDAWWRDGEHVKVVHSDAIIDFIKGFENDKTLVEGEG